MPYKDIIVMVALENVYSAVDAWTHGRHSPDVDKFYAQLVGDGIVGKDI